MEKYYDGDQEAFFREAHVINPFNKPVAVARPKLKRSGTEECEICFSNFPPSVSINFFEENDIIIETKSPLLCCACVCTLYNLFLLLIFK